ncbi:MAG: cation/multidrug efflux pump [Pseudomonadota bacterium]|nr:cation/multidrug efflux pump [Pseudomonadota bacterium]
MPTGSSSITVAAIVAVCGLVGLLFLVASGRRLRRHRYGACALHGLSSLVFFLAAAAVALLGFNLLTYARLTREQPAVTARFARAGEQQFNATLTYPSGAVQGYVLRGDEWQIDARVLKWRGFANVLSFDTVYRLERISGRYSDVDRERNAPRTVYALHPQERVDVWALLRTWHDYVPWADALYGSATFLPMADGAAYEVTVSQSGLVARPLNDAARVAVGAWH